MSYGSVLLVYVKNKLHFFFLDSRILGPKLDRAGIRWFFAEIEPSPLSCTVIFTFTVPFIYISDCCRLKALAEEDVLMKLGCQI